MIVRTLNELIGSDRDIDWGNGRSRRFLIERDGMGFTMTDTLVSAGSRSLLEYRNHMEACYCIAGSGEVHDVRTGKVHRITPGTIYALDQHDAHYLIAKDDLRLVCTFAPALQGAESHRLSGASGSSY